ncbi:MAG: hypothetical protein HY843_07780 [Bdellovibrio sp.]|nr:hypothetical protein [Bdellovibrio sp.]
MCLYPKIPKEILDASKKFSKQYPEFSLYENWFNNGPESLIRELKPGWEKRLVQIFNGKKLKLKTLGRSDLLGSKLFAYCDRQEDFSDCIKFNPTLKELKSSLKWVQLLDANTDWPAHCSVLFKALAKRLGYEWK